MKFSTVKIVILFLAGIIVHVLPSAAENAKISRGDEALLDKVQRSAFQFFWNEANPGTGLIKDRAGNFADDEYQLASVASVGFGLASLPIAVERGWVSKDKALRRALTVVRFFARNAENERGFFYHFLGMQSGKRASRCELSSVDTALFLAGAIVAREYFNDPDITDCVNQIYERIDFPWMMNNQKSLSMGWTPEMGFLKHSWNDYSEGALLTLLAIGAKGHPVPAEVWNNMRRKFGSFQGTAAIISPPLFTHQYQAAFFDFRDKHDDYADYFEDSKNATVLNYLTCKSEAQKFKTYQKGYWGLTASDGPAGYKAYGGRPGAPVSDGTVAPTAAITSIMFTPDISLDFLKNLYGNEKDWLWGKYGFCDSFNLHPCWKSPDVIGIDQGAILLGIENYRTGLIWKLFTTAPEIKTAMQRAGFKPGRRKLVLPEPPVYHVKQLGKKFDWEKLPEIALSASEFLENGLLENNENLDVRVKFAWDKDYLYCRAKVVDKIVVARKTGEMIWQDDCVELFLNPACDRLKWGNPSDYQIGFSPTKDMKGVNTWSWFDKKTPVTSADVKSKIKKTKDGYVIFARIKWTYLKFKPEDGTVLRASPSFHHRAADDSDSKYNWCFIAVDDRFELGKLILE